MPVLDNYMIADNNYLQESLRISKLVKEFPNNDLETKREKPKIRAVDELSLSMFKN